MCGKPKDPGMVGFLHGQPPLFCSLVKGGHRGTYGWSRFINLWHPYPRLLYRPSKRNPTSFDIFRHATDSYAFAPRTSVEWVDRIPPLPETSAISCLGAWRLPPSPRTWITPSQIGVMPHISKELSWPPPVLTGIDPPRAIRPPST